MADESTLEIAPPPRRVPLLVRARVLFGSPLSILGWVLFGLFGMSFFWLVVLGVEFDSLLFRGEMETAIGTATACERTRITRRTDDSGPAPVFAVSYAFTAPDGEEFTGVSYSIGTCPEEGAEVTVEFPKGKPAVSRIRGMRRSTFAPWAVFMVIFCAAGLCCILPGIVRGMKANHLLANGVLAVGRARAASPTAMRVAHRVVYEITFEFAARDGQSYTAIARTHEPEALADHEYEGLLYDPANPSYAAMMNSLPGSPRIDGSGNVTAGSAARGVVSLLLPATVVVCNVAFALIRFVI